MTEDTRPFCLTCRPPHRLNKEVNRAIYTCAKGHAFTQRELMERSVVRLYNRTCACRGVTSILDYVYGCWWKCRTCGMWVEK